MRSSMTFALLVLATLFFIGTPLAYGVPITGRTGPGGIERTDVSSNLRLWLEADNVTGVTSGNDITTWNNTATYSGAAGNATVQNTAPTFENGGGDVKNGNPVIRFSGAASNTVGDVLTGAGTFTAEKTFYVVGMQSAGATINSCCNGAISTASGNNGLMPDSNGRWMADYSGAGASASSPIKMGQYGIFTSTYDNTASAEQVTVHVDGATGIVQNSGTARGAAATSYKVGSRGNTGDNLGRFLDGDLGEIAVFNGVLNPVQRNLVDNYMSAKWDIALNTAGGATDRYSGDTLHQYDLDVFGVGNDGTNSVTNAGSNGMGIEAAGLSSGQWILAGHAQVNNGISLLESDNPLLVGQRWDRAWFVDNNGSSADAVLGFNFADAGLAGQFNPLDKFRLLYTGSASLDNWQVIAGGELGVIQTGNVITFGLTGAEFQSGFYTLGINVGQVPEPSSFLLLSLGMLGMIKRTRRRAMRG